MKTLDFKIYEKQKINAISLSDLDAIEKPFEPKLSNLKSLDIVKMKNDLWMVFKQDSLPASLISDIFIDIEHVKKGLFFFFGPSKHCTGKTTHYMYFDLYSEDLKYKHPSKYFHDNWDIVDVYRCDEENNMHVNNAIDLTQTTLEDFINTKHYKHVFTCINK